MPFPRFLPAFLALTLWGCKEAPPVSSAPLGIGEFRWAKTLSWEKRDSVVHLTLSQPWKGAHEALRYALVPRGRLFKAAPGEIVIHVPVRQAACLATVHVGFMQALGASPSIMAVGDGRFVHDSIVRTRIATRKVLQVGSAAQLNVERLIAAHPDLVLANAINEAEYAALQRVQEAGTHLLVTSEWMEDHPLARAEWVRLFGLLLGKQREADSLFAVVEASYLALVERARVAAKRSHRPTVLIGAPFRDSWFVSGGRSFMSRFIADAGADYLWAGDTTAGGVPLSFESVLTLASNAEVWLHPGDWRSLKDGLKQDSRFRSFTAFQRGEVYNNNAREAQRGFSDYWESGIVNPHRVLADLFAIFHPPASNRDSLFYYRRLP